MTESTSNRLVSYLRVSEDEILLIVINLDDIPIGGYDLNLSSGPLLGTYHAASLLDDTAINPLTANATGGFDTYAPQTEIPPYSIFVIHLIPS